MEQKERVIDLRQYFLFLWEKIWLVLLVACGLAVLLGAYNYKSQKSQIRAGENARDKEGLETIIQANHDKFYAISTDAQYTDAVKPAGTYNSVAVVYIDFNFDDIEGKDSVDFSNVITKKQQDVVRLMRSSAVIRKAADQADLRSEPDMKDLTYEDLSWLVNGNFTGMNLLSITVTDVDAKRAEKFCGAMVDVLSDAIKEDLHADEVRLISGPTSAESGKTDEVMASEASDASESSSAAVISVSKKRVLKYFLAGGVGGLIVIMLVLLVVFLSRDTVRTDRDLVYADLTSAGKISRKRDAAAEDYLRLANALIDRGTGKTVNIAPVTAADSKEKAADHLQDALQKCGKKVQMISGEDAAPETLRKKIGEAAAKADYVIVDSPALREKAAAEIAASCCDFTIAVLTYGGTKMKDALAASAALRRIEGKNGEALLAGVRHNA